MSLTCQSLAGWRNLRRDGEAKLLLSARSWSILLLLLLSLILGFRTYNVATKAQDGIDIESVEIALDLARGEKTNSEGHTHARMPGFALLLFAVSQVDTRLREGLACSLADRNGCKLQWYRSILIAQYVAAIGTMAVTLLLAWQLSRHWQTCVITLVLMAATTRLVDWTGVVRPPIWYHFLIAVYLFLSLSAYRRRSLPFSIAGGMILGLSCLFEPFTALLIPVSVMLVGRRPGPRSDSIPSMLRALGLIGGACGGISLIWVASGLSYDTSAIYGYIARHMSERVAFNTLDNVEWVASLVLPMPLIGDWIASAAPELNVRLGLPRHGSIALHGLTTIFRDALEHGGSSSGAILWIFKQLIWQTLAGYLLAIPPIFNRGILGGGGLVALIGLFHVPRMIAYARAEHRLNDLLVVLVPIVVLFLINTMLTGNGQWLNPMLVFLYIYAIAYVAGGW